MVSTKYTTPNNQGCVLKHPIRLGCENERGRTRLSRCYYAEIVLRSAFQLADQGYCSLKKHLPIFIWALKFADFCEIWNHSRIGTSLKCWKLPIWIGSQCSCSNFEWLMKKKIYWHVDFFYIRMSWELRMSRTAESWDFLTSQFANWLQFWLLFFVLKKTMRPSFGLAKKWILSPKTREHHRKLIAFRCLIYNDFILFKKHKNIRNI